MRNLPTLSSWFWTICLCVFTFPCEADTALGRKAYIDQDFSVAFAEFTKSADQGDALAQRYLATMYFRGQGTARADLLGTRLAYACAESGDAKCYLLYAESKLWGRGIQADYGEARIWARKAFAHGDAQAGLVLAQAYLEDPANRYVVKGRPDMERYNLLAGRNIQQRAEQIEAMDALATAAASGFTPARLLLATLMYVQSGGTGTAQTVIALLSGIEALPVNSLRYLQVSRQIAELGATRASPKLVGDAMPGVAADAVTQALLSGAKDTDQCKDFKLLRFLGPTEVERVSWLPLKHPLIANTYPVTGRWFESWSVNLCGTSYTVKIQFDVDGMGGAYYTTQK